MSNIGTDKKKASKEKSESLDLITLPTSSGTDLIMNILGSRGDIATVKDRRNEINHASQVKAEKDGLKRKMTLQSAREEFEIQIPNIEDFFGKGVKAKTASRKLFALVLMEANKTSLQKGNVINKNIYFPLQLLVDLGIYSNIRSARKGFLDNMAPLITMLVKGYRLKDGKMTGNGAIAPLFAKAAIDDGVCMVVLNDELNWNVLIQFYTYLPEYYFRLSSKADALLYTIFYLARQRGKELKEKGCFKIGFRTLQYRMGLPDEKGLVHAKRDIKDVIEEAITEIEENHRATYGNDFLQLTPKGYSEDDNVTKFLDNGYLEVRLGGEFLNPFIKAGNLKAQKVTQARKRQEKITDEAKAKNLAKTLEAEEKEAKRAGR